CCLGSCLLDEGRPAFSGEDSGPDIGDESSLAAHQCGRNPRSLNVVGFGASLIGEKSGAYLGVVGVECAFPDLQRLAGVDQCGTLGDEPRGLVRFEPSESVKNRLAK